MRGATAQCQRVESELETIVPRTERVYFPIDDARWCVCLEADDIGDGKYGHASELKLQRPLSNQVRGALQQSAYSFHFENVFDRGRDIAPSL